MTIRIDVPFSRIPSALLLKQEKVLICSLEKMNQVKGLLPYSTGVGEIKFYLKSQEGVATGIYLRK